MCVEALGCHRATALGREDVRSWRLFALKTAQGAEFVALDGMNARGAALAAANMQATSGQLDLVPLQIADLGSPQSVTASPSDGRLAPCRYQRRKPLSRI